MLSAVNPRAEAFDYLSQHHFSYARDRLKTGYAQDDAGRVVVAEFALLELENGERIAM